MPHGYVFYVYLHFDLTVGGSRVEKHTKFSGKLYAASKQFKHEMQFIFSKRNVPLKGTCFHFKQIIYICSTENPAAVMRNVLGGFDLVITATMHIYKQLFLESGTTDRD